MRLHSRIGVSASALPCSLLLRAQSGYAEAAHWCPHVRSNVQPIDLAEHDESLDPSQSDAAHALCTPIWRELLADLCLSSILLVRVRSHDVQSLPESERELVLSAVPTDILWTIRAGAHGETRVAKPRVSLLAGSLVGVC